MAEIILQNVNESFVGAPAGVVQNVSIPAGKERDVNYGLVQHNKLLRSKQILYVFNDSWGAFRLNRKPEQVVSLGFIDPALKTRLHIAWHFLVPALVFCVLAGAAISANWLPSFLKIPFAGTGLLLFTAGVMFSSSRVVVMTENGRAPLFELHAKLPDKKRFNKFINRFARSIAAAREQLPADNSRLALEMAEHRRLKESGVISEKQYEAAKKHILGNFSQNQQK